MTEITGNNITYTGPMIFNNIADTMAIRTPSEDSNDTFESAYDIQSNGLAEGDLKIGNYLSLRN